MSLTVTNPGFEIEGEKRGGDFRKTSIPCLEIPGLCGETWLPICGLNAGLDLILL